MEPKRVRSANFANIERDCLLEIVLKYSHILEKKATDSLSVREKNECWERVGREFNARNISTQFRDTISLKRCWDNWKKSARKTAAQNIMHTSSVREGLLGHNGLSHPLHYYTKHEEIGRTSSYEEEEVIPVEVSISELDPRPESQSAESENSDDHSPWKTWTPEEKTSLSHLWNQIRSAEIARRKNAAKACEATDKVNETKMHMANAMLEHFQTESKIRLELYQEMLKQEKLKTKIVQLRWQRMKRMKPRRRGLGFVL